MKKKEQVDYSKVQRHGMVDKRWYEDKYREMGECSYGEYVLYSDYQKLLNDKTPPRLPATFKDVVKVIEDKADALEKESFRFFERKDEINYGCGLSRYKEGQRLRLALRYLKEKVFVK